MNVCPFTKGKVDHSMQEQFALFLCILFKVYFPFFYILFKMGGFYEKMLVSSYIK